MYTMMLSLILAQSPVPLPPEVPPVIDDVKPVTPVDADFPRLRYLQAWSRSVATGKPIAVFVGVPPLERLYDVAIPVEMPRGWFRDYPASCVIIGRPSDDTLHWYRTLPATATEDDIRLAVLPRAAAPVYVDPVRSYAPPVMFAPSFGGGGFGRGGFGRGGGGNC